MQKEPTGLGTTTDASRALLATAADHALVRGLGIPIDALRASIETLAADFDDSDPRGQVLDQAARELRRLGRRVEELVDFSAPSAPQPLRCTAREIACAVRQQLLPDDRRRLVVASSEGSIPIWVDGPLLTRALRRLVENALEASSEEVLLSVRAVGPDVVFAVVDHNPSARFDPDHRPAPFASEKPDRLGLGLTLVMRDVERLSGAVDGTRTAGGDTSFRVRIPRQLARGEVAA